MSLLKKLIVNEKITKVEFPDIDGFVVELCYVGKERLTKIRNQSLEYKFNKRTRQREEEVNSDKFLELYSEAVIRGWSGLNVAKLAKLLPIDNTMDPNTEIPYSAEDALLLLKNSTIFDQFVTDSINNFENFEQAAKEETIKN